MALIKSYPEKKINLTTVGEIDVLFFTEFSVKIIKEKNKTRNECKSKRNLFSKAKWKERIPYVEMCSHGMPDWNTQQQEKKILWISSSFYLFIFFFIFLQL